MTYAYAGIELDSNSFDALRRAVELSCNGSRTNGLLNDVVCLTRLCETEELFDQIEQPIKEAIALFERSELIGSARATLDALNELQKKLIDK